MTDPIKRIKEDHRNLEALFKKFDSCGDRATKAKKTISQQICTFLTKHAQMEEVCLYPKLSERFNKEGDKLVEEAYAEHEVAKQLIAQIESLPPENPQFHAKVTVLKEYITHHVKEEEGELLPKTKKEFSKEELNELGAEIERFYEEKAE